MRSSKTHNGQVDIGGTTVDQIAFPNPEGDVQYTIAKQSGKYIALKSAGNKHWDDWSDTDGSAFWTTLSVHY